MNAKTGLQILPQTNLATTFSGGSLQRSCACGQHTPGGGECSACGKNRLSLQRTSGNSQNETQHSKGVPSIVHEVLNSPGQPLEGATRAFMEPRFGQDFSHVRIHTDGKAAESAVAVNALAYTVGRNVVFGANHYAPGTAEGNRLLAHELTHVVQQQGSGPGSAVQHSPSSTTSEGDRFESEADTLGLRVSQGERVTVSNHVGAAGVVARQGAPCPPLWYVIGKCGLRAVACVGGAIAAGASTLTGPGFFLVAAAAIANCGLQGSSCGEELANYHNCHRPATTAAAAPAAEGEGADAGATSEPAEEAA